MSDDPKPGQPTEESDLGADRRSGEERRQRRRRELDIPVEIDRRSGHERRSDDDRRKS